MAQIDGTSQDDILTGTSEADIFFGAAGDDQINGGAGIDTAKYLWARSDYYVMIDDTNGKWHVQGEFAPTNEGVDYFDSIERIQFSDGILAIDTGAGSEAGQAYRIYQAAFARTPDQGGLSYWLDKIDAGMELVDVAKGFVASAEFQSVYGTNPTNAEFVAKLYQNILGREAEAGGLTFWVNELDSGARDKATVLAQISESAENVTGVAANIDCGIWLG